MGLRFAGYRKRRQWVLSYKDPWSGKLRIKSFDDETQARNFERVQAEMYARERELIRRARRRAASGARERLTVAELLERYFASFSNPLTRRTSRDHAEPLTVIYGQRKAHCLTCDDIAAWMEVQRGRSVGQTTINRRVGILRAAYNWGVRSRHLTANPLTGLRLPTAKPQRIMPPSVREARLIHDAAAPHVRRVVVLGMATGARIGPSELFRLRWSDVDVAAGVIRMPNAAKGARDEARDVPIRDDILGLVRQWQAEDGAAGCPWVIHYRGARVRSVGKAWRNALRRAGITRRIRPYDLRHAFPSAALAHGADIKCVAEVMGHKDASMLLKVYQHTLFRERRRAVNAAPGLFAGSGRRQSAPRNRSGSKPDPSPRTLPPGPERVTASLAPVPVPLPAAPWPDRPPADSP